MTFEEYQKLAMRTDDKSKYNSPINRLINGLMGLNGEAGEAIDVLKKALFQGHKLEKEKLVEELGDSLWYLAEITDTINVSLEEIANANILKLVKRYPDGFSEKNSVNRDKPEVLNDSNGESDMPEMRDEP